MPAWLAELVLCDQFVVARQKHTNLYLYCCLGADVEFLACQVLAVTVAVSADPFVASSPAKAAGATLRTVAESAA